jgi:hypothetical protein
MNREIKGGPRKIHVHCSKFRDHRCLYRLMTIQASSIAIASSSEQHTQSAGTEGLIVNDKN